MVDTDGKSGFLHRLQKDKIEICYDEVLTSLGKEFADKSEIDELFSLSVTEITNIFQKIRNDCGSQKFGNKQSSPACTLKYMCGMVSRLILSSLIEGDRRDTAEFEKGEKFNFILADKALWKRQIDYFEDRIKSFNSDTPINKAREYISDKAKEFAEKECGIYRITVPTGAGKTLSTLRYALNHAEKHDKKRIIFVIPLLSVLDQNKKAIRDYILDKELITEHHSNVVKCDDDKDALDKYELLSETWETPILITTLVQLLNTLFSGKTTAIRRMKSLCNSVIVIDEVQTVPNKLLYMFNEAINFLSIYCGTTIILSSATQPCFEEVDYSMCLAKENDIVPLNSDFFKAFKRTEIIDKCVAGGISLNELTDFSLKLIEENESVLIICNTKKTALNLYNQLKLMCESKIYHLSTSMCMQHRIDTLKKINESLKNHEKIICVSTQLVEAGVDFSFESCIRIKAGIDNIAQAAGRCNRNNDFNHMCKVYIVSLKDENLSHLKEISTAQNCTTQFLNIFSSHKEQYKNDILSKESVDEYYSQLYNNFIKKSVFSYPVDDGDTIFGYLSENKSHTERNEAGDKYMLTQAFKTAGRLFKVFDDDTIDVIVPYNDEAKGIITDLFSQKAKFDIKYLSERLEKAKPYTIQIYTSLIKSKEHMLYQDDKGHFTALLEEFYNDETGLDENNSIF